MEPKQAEIMAKLIEMIEPVLRVEGKELVELEFRRESPGWVLRLFIDQEDGITVEDCAQISRVVGDLLDVTEAIRMPYHLEVSSPGLNRPLRKPEHFESVLGKIVEIRTLEPLGSRRRFKGTLKRIEHGQVTIHCDGQDYDIALDIVERARLCYFESMDS
ncbi:MAG: ribosome maturation factor RimP [Syntrophobacteraceae bacterium]|jgi:ribosome maturation factor RimP|nr:ribosome maturation factor RimP [Syntrophobacteraceae bacterium]